MSQVFYRKYRPQKFGDVRGQEQTLRVLKNAIAKNKLAHAYLFSGPRGTGKTTIARILAREAGCFDEDIIEIDAASSRGIDEARSLREAVHILPMRSPYKVYIIDEVHMLTREAFNTLLKTLEEPPKHTIFILATTEKNKVPDTIISRTQHFEFNKISVPEIVAELRKILDGEKLKAEDDALKLLAFFADGSLRDAENFLYQAVFLGDGMIKEEDIRLLLGAPREEIVNGITKLVLEGDTGGMLALLDELWEKGTDPGVLGRLLLRNFRAIYFLSLGEKTEKILQNEFSGEEIDFLKSLSGRADILERAVREVLSALFIPTSDYSAHIPIELALIKIATLLSPPEQNLNFLPNESR